MYKNESVDDMPQMCMQCRKSMMEWQKKMESMYPKIYFIVYPKVKYHCDMLMSKYGMMHIPDKDEMKEICEDIVKKIEHEMENTRDDDKDMTRQFGYGARRFLVDLAGILLINQLVGRPYYGYYPYYYPYYGGYQGYHHGYREEEYGQMYQQYEDYEEPEEE